MVKIDLESRVYDIVANCISCLISAGSACVCNAVCNNVIADTQARGGRVGLMKWGKYGLEAGVMFGVTPGVRDAVDSVAEMYNTFVDMCNAYDEKVESTQNYVEVN